VNSLADDTWMAGTECVFPQKGPIVPSSAVEVNYQVCLGLEKQGQLLWPARLTK